MVTGAMLKVLEVFHSQEAIQILGMTARCTESGEWDLSPMYDTLEAAGICPIKEYIQRRQATI